jgi:outer membrane lipoprotein SlyB
MLGTGTPQASANGYTMNQAQTVQGVQLGTVISLHSVTLAGSQTGIGVLGGGAAGAALGHEIGGGHGQQLATIVGALAGALGGQALEGAASGEQGELVTVKLDSGQVLAITQAADTPLRVGERVQVLTSQAQQWGQPSIARVLPLN